MDNLVFKDMEKVEMFNRLQDTYDTSTIGLKIIHDGGETIGTC